jgi:hypothetical protein
MRSKHPVDILNWIQSIADSCKTDQHREVTMRIIMLFESSVVAPEYKLQAFKIRSSLMNNNNVTL